MFRATLKSLLARKVRLVLTALSIVLGVGFVAGTFVLTDTMSAAFDQLFSTATRNVDVIVRPKTSFTPTEAHPGGSGNTSKPFPESVLDTVRAVDGVAVVEGGVTGYAQFVDPATGDAIGGFGPPTFGVNWTPQTGGFSIKQGRAPATDGEVAMDTATAQRYGFAVGDTVGILFQGTPQQFEIVGIAGFGEADNIGGATSAIFDTETAQRVLDREGRFDAVSVVGQPGIAATELRTRIAEVLPNGVEAITAATSADEAADAVQQGLGFFRTALLVFALVALFVGAFIIFNTFSIIVAQRTRELGLLRAMGASRRQVSLSVLTEAALIGIVASIVGIVVGIGIALGLKGLLGVFGVDLPTTSIQVLPRTAVVAIGIGVVVTVVSSFLPARRAARIAPIEALQATPPEVSTGTRRRRVLVGSAVLVAGAAVLLFGLFGGASQTGILVGVGAAVTFVGIGMLSPLVARPIAQTVGAPLPRLGMSGKLGRENAMRNPRRTAATASALMIGLGLVSLVAILGASLKASSDAVLQETLKADLILTTSSFTAFSPQVAAEVQQLPEVGAVTEFRQNVFRLRGKEEFLTAVDPATIEDTTTLGLQEGGVASLSRGEVLVYADAAKDNGWDVGDRLRLQFPATGFREVTIGGTFEENRIVGNFVSSLDLYDQNYPERLDTFTFVTGASGVPPAQVRTAVEDALRQDFSGIQVQDQTAFKEQQAGFVDQLLGLVTAMLTLAVVIALFGIVNTLSLSILERRRELGLLRAVGMTRKQVTRMVRWEAVIIALIGALLGVVIGVLFGWAMQQALEASGVTVLAIPGAQLAFYVVFAGAAGVLTAILPARRAARLNILEAISYE